MSKADALDERLAAEEAAPMSAEEGKYYEEALQSLPADQRQLFGLIPGDVLCVVRGFANAKHRKQETLQAIKSISEWRKSVHYYQFFDQQLPGFKQFHDLWKESIYGPDKYGHMVQCIRIQDIDTDAIEKMNDQELERLQGQKMKAYAVYKEDMAKQTGTLRYKHTLLIDLTHIKMSMVSSSSKRQALQNIFSIGSKYFPETIWKIYLVNGPMVFRAVFACIKPILAPETIAKINMLGSMDAALKKLEQDGLPRNVLPEWVGGTSKGKPSFQYVSELIEQRRQHGDGPPGSSYNGQRRGSNQLHMPMPPPGRTSSQPGMPGTYEQYAAEMQMQQQMQAMSLSGMGRLSSGPFPQ
mmetsp:Transcript_64843/g.159606  ORF Transcript_64843/g.159606 Transcript_64843/m.159606 type:complete len:354 (+) Transcript_64843:202-1263(+)|eukprot:CAMPEP_0206215880 /NCGR_PEP_ID=MMETSP0047_2-20121206/2427_1 /ASSEMBLY_ACC=CAM_ASM_000192 /TAXON_ID=195065 /ORGANISM="Chroomonas mesostigmatica_cf, Strain CCMP1168" /LENGTH=353 /DNA_ID=CAMNT_0053638197 /DNA_START=182 /DNA_END=1243 /DNA_ORIENTATION=+